MTARWTSKFIKNGSGGDAATLDEDLLDEELVLFLQGLNSFGDEVFSYLKLKGRSLVELKNRMVTGQTFSPGEFGEVLAAGRGIPSRELQEEMAVTYHIMDVPVPPTVLPKPVQQPLLWNDSDVEDGGDISGNEASPSID